MTDYEAAWVAGIAAMPNQAINEALANPDPRLNPEPDSAQSSTLSAREIEVVALVAPGFSNRQIAQELVVSQRTVEWHVSKILSRLTLTSRAQLALWARERGLISPD